MFCYRLERHSAYEGLTLPMVDVQRQVSKHSTSTLPVENDVTFTAAMTLTFELFKHIGWDGTRTGEVRCFTIPGLYSMMVGLIITDLQGRLFVASPIPLPHIERDLDWDARVSHEEIQQARRAVKTGHLDKVEKPTPRVGAGGWRTSQKGNLWASVNGINVTVIPQGSGYCALIRKPGSTGTNQLIRTKVLPTPQEVQRHVLREWYDIIDPRDSIGAEPIGDDEDPWA